MRSDSQARRGTSPPPTSPLDTRTIRVTPNCSKLGFASNCIKALLTYLCIFRRRRQPDVSSEYQSLLHSVGSLWRRGTSFHHDVQCFANLAKVNPILECPFLRGAAAAWAERGGPELQGGTGQAAEASVRGACWHGRAAVFLWKFHLRGEMLQIGKVAALTVLLGAKGTHQDPLTQSFAHT